MSADNGVYILATKGRERGKKEYRVAHAQAIENIDYAPDYHPGGSGGLNTESVQYTFGKSPVFTDRKIAEGYAQRLHEEQSWTEYGICFLDRLHVRYPRHAVVQRR